MSPAPDFDHPRSESDWRRCLGRKASLRYRLPDSAESPFSEAFGVIASVAETDRGAGVSILTKRGETKVVPIADIEVAKVFPA